MKISQKTLSIWQTFAQISTNLLVKPGNKILTKNAVGSIQGRAEVEEQFPVQFAIYDLSQLLSLINVSQDADIEFGEKSMLIKYGNDSEVEYYYADASLITQPPENPPGMEKLYTFKMTANDITAINKTASIVSSTMISVIGDKGQAILTISDPKNSTSHSYKKTLGPCEQTFNVKMAVDSFKPTADEYTVSITQIVSKTKVLAFFFECTTRSLTYLIAADASSKF